MMTSTNLWSGLAAPSFPTSSASPVGDSVVVTSLDTEMVEIGLLLPRVQIQALEQAAKLRGLSVGQMLRRLIGAVTASPQQS